MRFALRVLALIATTSNAIDAQPLASVTERIVKVGDHAVQTWTGGPSDGRAPLVVFENGWNGVTQLWGRVAAEVAKFARSWSSILVRRDRLAMERGHGL